MIGKLLDFREDGEIFNVYNYKEEYLGFIKRERIGRFMHWCFFPEVNTYFTNGCMKEISNKITECYALAQQEVMGKVKND